MQKTFAFMIAGALSFLLMLLLLLVVVDGLYVYPVPALTDLPRPPSSQGGLLHAFESRLWFVWAVLTQVWLLWGIVPLCMLIGYVAYKRLRGNDESKLMDQIYFLEQNLEQVSKLQAKSDEVVKQLHGGLIAAFESAPEGLLYINREGVIDFTNPIAEQLLQKWSGRETQFQHRLITDVLPKFTESSIANAWRSLGSKQLGWSGTYTLPRENGTLHVKLCRGVDGDYMILRDISHHYVAENQLATSHALLGQILQHLPQPTAVLDEQGRYVCASTSWGEFFGVDVATLVGEMHAAKFPAFPENFAHIWMKLSQSSKPIKQSEVPLPFGDGEKIVTWSAQPWQTVHGQFGGAILHVADVTAQSSAEQKLTQLQEQENRLAYSDLLTGLPNRQLFYDRLNMALAMAYRQLTKVGVMFLDLDGFKAVNDKLGHEVGDMLLKEVGRRIQHTIRKSDTVARLGGDEFTIVANVRDQDDCRIIAKKLIEVISAPYKLGPHEDVRVTTSIGISIYPVHGGAAVELIRKSDLAMYIAKKNGKNQYHMYGPEDEDGANG